jgi:hypothetical protein
MSTKNLMPPNILNGPRLRKLYKNERLIRETGQDKRAKRMGICGNTIQVSVNKKYNGMMRFEPSVRCKDRVCPICNAFRASKLSREVEKLGEKMSNPHLLTITAAADKRNNLELCFKNYKESVRKLKRNKTWFKKYVNGGIEHIEVVKQKNKGWHIHSHMLVDLNVDREVENMRMGAFDMELDPIKEHLQRVLVSVGLGRISDIRPVTEGYGKEIAKYALKPSKDIKDCDFKEMIIALKGKRMVSRFGNCYGIKPDNEEFDMEAFYENYEYLGTIPEVVKIGFTQGLDQKYIQPSMEAIRKGLIELA